MDFVSEQHPDLVLTDIMMPKLDGFGLLARLRENAITKSLPVVLLSARAGEESRVEGLEAGADDYLIKPFGARELLARVRANLSMARFRQESIRLEERLRAEEKTAEKIRASEQRFRRFYESGMLGVIFWNVDGMITDANDKFLEIVGYRREDLKAGRLNWSNMTPQEYHHLDEAAVKETQTSGVNKVPFEKEYVRKDGSRVQVILAGAMLDEAHFNGVAFVLDISERKQMEEELRKSRDELELRVLERTAELATANEILKVEIVERKKVEAERHHYMSKLEESNQALQDFASIASHDLQEPLRKVTAFGNMLKQEYGGSLGDHGGDYLERILNSNKRMQSLLSALLEYSRLSTRTASFEEVALTKVIKEVLSDLEVRIQQTGGEVHVGELPLIQADPTQMRQLFQNLIGNALKFHKQDEKPFVKVSCIPENNGFAQIVVEDNGIGFEEQYLEKIFAPFQRLHGKSSLYEGTGMGLAICKKIIERHGGSIIAQSEPDKGSVFTVRLPKA